MLHKHSEQTGETTRRVYIRDQSCLSSSFSPGLLAMTRESETRSTHQRNEHTRAEQTADRVGLASSNEELILRRAGKGGMCSHTTKQSTAQEATGRITS